MRSKTLYCAPQHGPQTFTTGIQEGARMHVSEWDLVTSAVAEEVMKVDLAASAYERMVTAHKGDERKAQREIVASARRHVERAPLRRLGQSIGQWLPMA